MSESPPLPSLDAAFAALADPTRRAILARLMQGAATVQELAAPLPVSQPAVSRHLKVLEEAGLIGTRVAGTARPRHLNPAAMAMLWDWLGAFRASWEVRFTALDAVLAGMDAEETTESPGAPAPEPKDSPR